MERTMNYPMRSIAFVTELIHPPKRHDAAALQRLHSVAFADGECRYQNFQMLPVGAQMSNPPGRAQSVSTCTLLADRVQVREEMTGIGREEYEARLERMARYAMLNLDIQAFVVQQYVVRALINSRYYVDSREFVARALLNMETESFASLDRTANILGIRFVLGTGDAKQGVYNVRVESFAQDHRSIFIENVATFRTWENLARRSIDLMRS